MGYTLEFLSVNITLGHPLCLVVEVPLMEHEVSIVFVNCRTCEP